MSLPYGGSSPAIKNNQWSPPRMLRYRPHVTWIYVGGQTLGWLVLTLGFAGAVMSMMEEDFVRAAVFGGLGILFALLLYYFNQMVVKPYATLGVQVVSDRLILENRGTSDAEQKLEIPFSQVVAVHFSFLANFGGWFQIEMDNGRRYKFTAVLERSEMILDAINQYDSSIVDQVQLSAYRRTAVIADHSWARIYQKMGDWKAFFVNLILVPMGLAGIVYYAYQSLYPTYPILLFHFVFLFTYIWVRVAILYVLLNIVDEVFHTLRTRGILLRSPFQVRRNMELEAKSQVMIGVAFYVCSGLLLFYLLHQDIEQMLRY